MTFDELQNKTGKLIESEWHQAKGGGWVQNTATVEKEENVTGNAIVSGHAQVYGHALVYGNAIVSDYAIVTGNAIVSGNSIVSGHARVDSAIVSDYAQVYGCARVSGNMWKKTPLFILDSRNYGCTNVKHGHIQIGCEIHTYAEWQGEIGKQLAKDRNFTAAEIEEFTAIVELFVRIGK